MAVATRWTHSCRRLRELVSLLMKPVLRERLNAQIAGLETGTVRQHSAAVWERLAVLPEFVRAQCVCVYVSFGNEIETHGLIRQLLALGRRVGAPAFRDGYVPVEIRDFDRDLVAGKLGILEPRPDAPTCRTDAWLVPGLAFDATGNRLGRGKGYYDGMLRESGGVKIALAHDFQVLPAVPVAAHDVRMDWIVTETRVVHCNQV